MTFYEVTHQDDLVERVDAETPLEAARLAICNRLATTMQQSPMESCPAATFIATVKTDTGIRMFRVDFAASYREPSGLMAFPFVVREEQLD